jgi:hypothetical protein
VIWTKAVMIRTIVPAVVLAVIGTADNQVVMPNITDTGVIAINVDMDG